MKKLFEYIIYTYLFKNKSFFMLVETSLIAKVITILAPQLLIILGIPLYIVLKARKAVFANRRVLGLKFREAYNLDRQLDIAIDWDEVGVYSSRSLFLIFQC